MSSGAYVDRVESTEGASFLDGTYVGAYVDFGILVAPMSSGTHVDSRSECNPASAGISFAYDGKNRAKIRL